MSSLTWWIAGIVGALLLVVLLVPAFTGNNLINPDIAGPPQTGVDTEIIRDADAIALVPPQTDLEGRTVEIAQAPVTAVINDMAYWIGTTATDQVLVVANNTTNVPVTGDSISVMGTVQKMPDPNNLPPEWNISPDDLSRLQNENYYILATQVEVLQ